MIRGVLLALTQLKVINSTSPGSTRGQLGALGLLLDSWLSAGSPSALRLRCAVGHSVSSV